MAIITQVLLPLLLFACALEAGAALVVFRVIKGRW